MSFVRNTPEMIWVEAEEGNAGDHFDRLILDRLLSSLGVQPAEFLSRITPQNSWKMLKITEEAKIALAQQEEIPVNLFADDRTMSQSRVLSRQEFEGLIQPSLEKHFTTIDQAFSASDLAADDLDAVAIVGGSTRIPYLNQRLVEKYRKPVVTILEEKVVLGAAHYAEMIQAELSEEASRQDRRQPERNQPAPVKVIQPPSSLIAAPALPRQEPTQSLSGLEWVKKQIDQGNIGQALQRYPCDKKKPQYVDIYRALGKELNQQAVHYMNQGGIPQEAQKRLELALTYFPENETIRKNLTTLYHQDAINFLETKQWNNLFQLVDKIHTVQLNPLWLHEFQYPLVEEIVRQAQRCEKKGEWEKAVEWLKQGLSVQFATDQLRVKLADTYEKWGIFLKEKNDYQAARECFIQGLNYLPNHAGMIKELQQFQKSKRHRKR